MKIERIDHFVLTVRDIAAICDFYSRVLGMEIITFGEGSAGRKALKFGNHKINLHEAGHEFEPKADVPTPGSADFCLITSTPIEDVWNHLIANRVTPLQAPAERTGAVGKIVSIYFRDPDGNLIEVSNYV